MPLISSEKLLKQITESLEKAPVKEWAIILKSWANIVENGEFVAKTEDSVRRNIWEALKADGFF